MMVPTGTIFMPTKAPTNKLGVATKGPAAKAAKFQKATNTPKGGAKSTKDSKSTKDITKLAKANVAKGKLLPANADAKEDPLFTR
jgi:hypothetical protein